MKSFIIGVVIGLGLFVLGAYLFARSGGIDMATTAKPLPFEGTVARTALHASIDGAVKTTDPLPENDANFAAGAKVYLDDCSVCHGLPGQPESLIAAGEFPKPPQLLVPSGMVTDDPEGETYWKVSNGIRLSGMPGFASTLSETQRWQVTMLVAHADKIPPSARQVIDTPSK